MGGVGGKGKDGGGTRKGAGVSQMADGSKKDCSKASAADRADWVPDRGGRGK